MIKEKTTKIPQQGKKVAGKTRGRASKGRPKNYTTTAMQLEGITIQLMTMCRHYGFRFETLQCLLMINGAWQRKRCGVSVTGLVKMCNWYSGNAYDMLYARIEDLVNRGLVEVVGKGQMNCNLYAPTVKASRELGTMSILLGEAC